MVWGAVSSRGKLVFVEPGVKVNAAYYYREAILEVALKARGPMCLRIGPMDFSAGPRTGPQSKNRPGLVPGRNPGFHPVIRMTSIQPRSESAGLCHMGHFGGEGQRYPTH